MILNLLKFFRMRKLMFILGLFLIVSCGETKLMNQIKFDQKQNSDILVGYTNLDGLKKMPFGEWFNAEYKSYNPDIETLNQINKADLKKKFKINIVMGSWCSDSQREVPRLIKILEGLDYPVNSIVIINVDSQKQAEGTIVNQLNITKIPTIIVFKQKHEIGRIIESPEISLEKDLLKIINK